MTGMDKIYMKRAIALARKGLGRTSPNPAVGCVIVKEGRVIGEGWHNKAGQPHAEINALAMAGDAAKGSDVYVTLEPCCHTGQTPPCSDALIKAGIKRIIAGMSDPNPRVNGGGLRALEQAGIETCCGVLEDECRAINRPFIKMITTGLPYVIFKSAMTMDGHIATVTGDSRWISCEESRKYVHRMRANCDAIIVGVDTIIADNPQLTVRHVRGRNPIRIIVDTTLRTPESVYVLEGKMARKTIIATTETNPRVHLRYLQQGATIIVCEKENGMVCIKDLLRNLAKTGIQSVLLEGGSRLAGSMLQNGLIDEFVFFYAPKIIGSNGFSPFSLEGIHTMQDVMRLTIGDLKRCGDDVLVQAWPEKTCSPA